MPSRGGADALPRKAGRFAADGIEEMPRDFEKGSTALRF
jgi:hypothetical protein